jgi:hypothetical protein
MRPAPITISAFVLGLGATLCGVTDLVDPIDAALTLGFSAVLAIIGIKET